MNGAAHLQAGIVAGLAYGHVAGMGTGQMWVSAVIAAGASRSALSPDVDQTWWWRRVDDVVPDEAIGHPMGHRLITHWWGLPVAAAWWIPTAPDSYRWTLWVLLAGWCSHLLGDLLFGGLHVFPWNGTPVVRFGLKTGGLLECGVWRGRKALPFGVVHVVLGVGILWLGIPVLWSLCPGR